MQLSPVFLQRMQMLFLLVLTAVAAHLGYRAAHPEGIKFREAEHSFNAEDWQSAIKLYKDSLDLGIHNPRIYSRIAHAYGKMNNYPEAIAWYNKFIEVKPDELWARKALAGMYTANGQFEKAAEQYRIIMQEEAKNSGKK